ncbi:MAG: RHS repeat-associated core domain-containing protein, partial [Rudaea sp.]
TTDRLTTITGTNPATYTWDQDGQLQSKTDASGTTNYTFNVRGELTGVALPGGTTIAYTYGPDGNITSRTKTGGSTTSATNYLVDPNLAYAQVVAEYGADGHATSTYVYGDELLMRITPSGATDYHHDGLHSVTLLTDDAGNAVQTYGYDAWGNLVESTGVDDNSYRYTSERADEDTGLIYLRARWYAPNLGRFVLGDPLSGTAKVPLSSNKYLYANADPLDGVDPSGMMDLIEVSISEDIAGSLETGAEASGRIVVRQLGCQLLKAGAEEAITGVIYVFLDGITDLPYVGQSTREVDARLAEHIAEGKRTVKQVLARFEVVVENFVSKDGLRIAEQKVIDSLGGIIKENGEKNLSNVVNAISKNRGRLTAPFNALCK